METKSTDNTGREAKGRDDIYEVEEIVGMKTEGEITVYRVRWKGYGPQSDTWEPESNLRTVWKMVEKYKSKTNNRMPLDSHSRRRGRPSNTSITTVGTGSRGTTDAKNSSIVDYNRKGQQLVMNGIKRQKTALNERKNHKKKLKYSFTTEKSKNTFWKDLEDGKIDVFKEDLYSRVKSRASSRGNSMENSPKQSNSSPKECDKYWPNTDSNDCDTTADHYMDGDLRIKFCKTEALMAAIKDCNRNSATILIKNGSDINSTFGNKYGSTPLMICSEENNVEMSDFLLSNGALQNMQNQNGDTALMIACRLGFDGIIKLLLIYGSNFAIVNNSGQNALRIARKSENKCIQDILIEHISKLTISLEVQVLNILCNTAKIVNALFPIQCYSLSEGKQFRLMFEFDLERHRKPGVGYILFVANTSISETGIECHFSGPNIVEEVLLNGTAQKPLTEGSQFFFSFVPLTRGSNELVLKTTDSQNSGLKLLVCAYELQLITDSGCDEQHI